MRVVIVDDNEPLLHAMEQCVASAGHDVVVFAQFESAKTYLATTQFDVLVTDVRLGAYNGLQLAMFAKLEHPETTAIVLSGFDDPVLRKDAASIGARFCLKPVGTDALLDGIASPPSQSVRAF
jgi:DNA-binding NtrC family response regulator